MVLLERYNSIRKKYHLRLAKTGLNSEVVLISSGLNSGILLYHKILSLSYSSALKYQSSEINHLFLFSFFFFSFLFCLFIKYLFPIVEYVLNACDFK